MSKIKNIDSLMKYLRDRHNIAISGGHQKKKTKKYRLLSWLQRLSLYQYTLNEIFDKCLTYYKGLNSIAHNDVVFDTRFKSSNPNGSLLACLRLDTQITNINFHTIIDYLILVIYLLKNFHVTKTELNKVVNKFEILINNFRTLVPISIYNQIFHTDTRNKLNLLKSFIST